MMNDPKQTHFKNNIELAEYHLGSEEIQPALTAALAAYLEADAAARLILKDPEMPEYLIRLGNILFALEEYPKSVDCFILVENSVGETDLGKLASAKKALTLAKTGKYSRAIELLLGTLQTPWLDEVVRNKTTKYLADVYLYAGQHAEAIRYYENAYRELQTMEDYPPDWPLEILNNLASAHYEAGQYSLALEKYHLVVGEISNNQLPGFNSIRISALSSIAQVYIMLYDVPSAKRILASIDRRTATQTECDSVNLMLAQAELTEFSAGIPEHSEHLDWIMEFRCENMERETDRNILNLQSYVELRRGHVGSAISLQSRLIDYSRKTENRHELITHLFNLCLYLQHARETWHVDQIPALLEEIETLLQGDEKSMDSITRYIKIARVYSELGCFEAVGRIVQRVFIMEHELFRSIVFSGNRAHLYYTDLLNLLANLVLTASRKLTGERDRLESHFVRLYLKTKNLSFTQNVVLGEQLCNAEFHDPDLLLQYRQKVKEMMVREPSGNSRSAEKIKSEVESLEQKIKSGSGYFQRINDLLDVDWRVIQGRLDEDEGAIVFFRYEHLDGIEGDNSGYAAFLFKPGMEHPVFCQLEVSDNQLRDMLPFFIVRDYREGDSFRITVEYPMVAALGKLYDLLFRPVMGYLEYTRQIWFTVDGLLNLVPFHALLPEKNLCLTDKFDLIQLHSLRDLKSKSSAITVENMALFGGIDFGTPHPAGNINDPSDRSTLSSIRNIAGAEQEIGEISEIFRAAGVMPEINSRLDMGNIHKLCDQRSPAAIHFLTHGYFFNDELRNYDLMETGDFSIRDINSHTNPLLRSGLIASDYNFFLHSEKVSSGERGAITAYDISNLKLDHTFLVTVHACETALGAVRNGESYGLASAFKKAGVQFVILTLWKVQYTEFYIFLYRHLLAGPTHDVRRSFNLAMAEMRAKYPNPYYWGGFVLVG